MVAGYRHLPGHHCGSTALRNLLAFAGTEISEELAFGLGAGADFFYIPLDGQSPSRLIAGRTSRLEEQFLELTGLAAEMRTFAEPAQSWNAARASVDAGVPALLLTDLFHLDHYGNSAHFPGHAVVLAGYDDEQAHLSDTGFEELQLTRLDNLASARHGNHPIFPLEGHMLTLAGVEPQIDLDAAAARSIERNARQMLEPALGEYEGIPALRRFAAEVESWPSQLEDWSWCARFAYQTIERRGTGGGMFRLMYARYLAECGHDEGSSMAARAAADWTELAGALLAASETEAPEPERWRRAGELATAVLEAEQRLWPALAS